MGCFLLRHFFPPVLPRDDSHEGFENTSVRVFQDALDTVNFLCSQVQFFRGLAERAKKVETKPLDFGAEKLIVSPHFAVFAGGFQHPELIFGGGLMRQAHDHGGLSIVPLAIFLKRRTKNDDRRQVRTFQESPNPPVEPGVAARAGDNNQVELDLCC